VSPYTTRTDENGVKTVFVDMNFGFFYKGSLRAYSGTAFEQAPISVEE
jgi:hypothetical protein